MRVSADAKSFQPSISARSHSCSSSGSHSCEHMHEALLRLSAMDFGLPRSRVGSMYSTGGRRAGEIFHAKKKRFLVTIDDQQMELEEIKANKLFGYDKK